MEKKVAEWIKYLSNSFIAGAIAAGIAFGARQADQATMADLQRRMADNERADEAFHNDSARFRSVDLGGFSDPRPHNAVDSQVRDELERYRAQCQREFKNWCDRLRQLNPTIQLPAGD